MPNYALDWAFCARIYQTMQLTYSLAICKKKKNTMWVPFLLPLFHQCVNDECSKRWTNNLFNTGCSLKEKLNFPRIIAQVDKSFEFSVWVWWLTTGVNLMRSKISWDVGLQPSLWRIILVRVTEVRRPAWWYHSLGLCPGLYTKERVSCAFVVTCVLLADMWPAASISCCCEFPAVTDHNWTIS